MGQKCSWALVIKPNNFYFVPSVLYCIFDTFPVGWVGGWVGGWINKLKLSSAKAGVEVRLNLAIGID